MVKYVLIIYNGSGLKLFIYDGFVMIALYIQAKENDAIIILRIIIEKMLPFFMQKLCSYN